MKYYYERPDIVVPLYGQTYILNDPVYKEGTLYKIGNRSIVVCQKRFDPINKVWWWGSLDPWLANDIYTNQNFLEWFNKNSSAKSSPIFEVRKVMWALRMKPLKKRYWE